MFGQGKMGPFFGGYGGIGTGGFSDHSRGMMMGPQRTGPMGSSVPTDNSELDSEKRSIHRTIEN